jgi:hypothetical protein
MLNDANLLTKITKTFLAEEKEVTLMTLTKVLG